MAKAQFQQATTLIDKKVAVQNWQSAIDRLTQIPSQTMAGRKSQQLASNSIRDMQEMAGLAAGNAKVASVIGGAEEFAKKAAESGRNPPHSSDRWKEIESMWQQAIYRLENMKVSADDLQGYGEVQKRLAEYRSNLSEVRVRLKNEQDSIQALERANQNLAALWASLPKDGKNLNQNRAIGDFMSINNELEKIKDGTTVYLKAQEIKLQVQQQLRLLQQAR